MAEVKEQDSDLRKHREMSSQGNCAVLWTGGKDSALALYEAQRMGYDVAKLVTFAPANGKFLAHPLSFMACQAEALHVPRAVIEIKEPYKKSYEDAIHALKDKEGLDVLVTGDIAEVDGYPNWVKECSESAHVEVLTPLWKLDRLTLANRLISNGFEVIFSCVKKPWFTADWIGKTLNVDTLEQLKELNQKTGLDICGENGEYHTLVLDGPSFKKRIQMGSHSTIQQDSLMYIDIHGLKLCNKP